MFTVSWKLQLDESKILEKTILNTTENNVCQKKKRRSRFHPGGKTEAI